MERKLKFKVLCIFLYLADHVKVNLWLWLQGTPCMDSRTMALKWRSWWLCDAIFVNLIGAFKPTITTRKTKVTLYILNTIQYFDWADVIDHFINAVKTLCSSFRMNKSYQMVFDTIKKTLLWSIIFKLLYRCVCIQWCVWQWSKCQHQQSLVMC